MQEKPEKKELTLLPSVFLKKDGVQLPFDSLTSREKAAWLKESMRSIEKAPVS